MVTLQLLILEMCFVTSTHSRNGEFALFQSLSNSENRPVSLWANRVQPHHHALLEVLEQNESLLVLRHRGETLPLVPLAFGNAKIIGLHGVSLAILDVSRAEEGEACFAIDASRNHACAV